jgi:hypothetical protein
MDLLEQCLIYRRDGIVKISSKTFPILSGSEIQKLADEVINFHTSTAVISSENIFVLKTGNMMFGQSSPDIVEKRRVSTRVENFVSTNKHWTDLCCTGGLLSKLVGQVCRDTAIDDGSVEPWCLYKEKLNIKPAGSSGFAPHLDSPSLSITGLCDAFVTVMIAIDDMTIENGCLQVCRGDWNEANSLPCESLGDTDVTNPDGNGRRGAIQSEAAAKLQWEYVECLSGDVYIFSDWLPHRSAANATQFPRRAVFLTYNHSEYGELSESYYHIMRDMRSSYLKHRIAESTK